MNSIEIRAELFDRLRRDLVGPSAFPRDDDIAEERLPNNPSRWYLTGFIAPADDCDEIELDELEEQELLALSEGGSGAGGAAGDDGEPEQPVTHRRFLPSSIGMTAILPVATREFDIELKWGDYVAEPPLPLEVLEGGDKARPEVEWLRKPRHARITLAIPPSGELKRHLVPDSAAPSVRGGGLEIGIQCRRLKITPPGEEEVEQQIVSVFVTNRRRWVARRYADLTFAFQIELALITKDEFCPQLDLSRYKSTDSDDRLADLHYRDVAAYAVGRNASVAFEADPDGKVRRVTTCAMPRASVERVQASQVKDVTFGMGALAALASESGDALAERLAPMITAYAEWRKAQEAFKGADSKIATAEKRVEIADQLIAAQSQACDRIAEGIELLRTEPRLRKAFEIMNRSMEMAADKRSPLPDGKKYEWRPFQLAFILLNIAGIGRKVPRGTRNRRPAVFPNGWR